MTATIPRTSALVSLTASFIVLSSLRVRCRARLRRRGTLTQDPRARVAAGPPPPAPPGPYPSDPRIEGTRPQERPPPANRGPGGGTAGAFRPSQGTRTWPGTHGERCVWQRTLRRRE